MLKCSFVPERCRGASAATGGRQGEPAVAGPGALGTNLRTKRKDDRSGTGVA